MLPLDDEKLAFEIKQGAPYYIVDDKMSDDDRKFVCMWLNSDQDQNSATSEAHATLKFELRNLRCEM